MDTWFDLMRQAQASPAFAALGRQFGLSEEQAQAAMTAFLPAFALGLQRAMLRASPNPFLQSLADGNLWPMAGDGATAQREGRKVLDRLFRSDEASRRVAQQVADFTGLNLDLMRQILPLLAGIAAGNLNQWMAAQGMMPAPASPEAKTDKVEPKPTDPWTAFWTGWLPASPEEAEKPQETAATAYEDLVTRFLRIPQPEPLPEPEASPSPPWGMMMEKGHEMQMRYLASLQSILDDAWKSGERRS